LAIRLAQILERAGTVWPGPIEQLPEVGSTNDWLKGRAREGAPEWSVVVADRQSAGRGRLGHTWSSPPGNLFLSVLVRPRFPALTLIPLAAGLAVAEALPTLAARLKWPNDVLVGGRKLAGVLAEAISGAGGVESVVVGIGVNVMLKPEDLPPPLQGSATSWLMETAEPREPLEVAAAVLGRLSVWYHALAGGQGAALVAAWRERSVPWWGRGVVARHGDQDVRGIARGVSEAGALLIELADGSQREILAGEVQEVRAAPP
jgi:BirA family transcriptional regulator, biotin operon repressor / biotin---[acetyl-CoA-carboxylase] ligase